MNHSEKIFSTTLVPTGATIRNATTLNLLARAAQILAQASAFVLLARLVEPADFGLVSMAAPFIGPIAVLGDLGLSAAVLQSKTINRSQASTLLFINIAVGVLLFVLVSAAFPFIADMYKEQKVMYIGWLLGTTFIISGMTAVQRSLLRRALKFKLLFWAQIISSLTMIVAAYMIAILGGGYWAVASIMVSGPLSYTVMIWIFSGWKPARLDWGPETRAMVRYGNYYLGYLVMTTVGRQADNILIGWRYGSEALGPYALAYRLFMLPNQQLFGPIEHVMVPALSRVRDDSVVFKEWYLKSLKYLAIAALPPAIFASVCSDTIVAIVAGEKWQAAAGIIAVLAPAGAVQSIVSSAGWILQAQGRSDKLFRLGCATTAAYLLSFSIGIGWGALGVATAFACANLAAAIPSILYSTREAAITAIDIVKSVAPGVIASGMVFASEYIMSRAVIYMNSEYAELYVFLVMMMITLVIMIVFGGREFRGYIMATIKKARRLQNEQ